MEVYRTMTYLLWGVILFPFFAAVPVALSGKRACKPLAFAAALLEMAAGLALASLYFLSGSGTQTFFAETEVIDYIMMAGEAFLMALIIVQCLRRRRILIMLLSVVQTAAVLWLELCTEKLSAAPHIALDRLSILMVLVVTVVGGLICLYAVGYMKRYHIHHADVPDRVNFFLAMLFVFLGAMCGLILSENMNWLYFFWEITSVVSFLLIGYTRSPEAVKNSFRALWMNLLGGAGFCGGILYANLVLGTADIFALTDMEPAAVVLPVSLLAFAALTKSAQMPFSSWLLGAMVAPTPSSALLHSATMVKAGVYLLIRLSPAMCGQLSGTMVAYVGAFTFLVTSLLAISQRDAKKVLAYSTISNLGLITACAGIGREDTACAAVLLILFHAVSKSMLFQCVGAIENATGNRDIEWMRGLAVRLPKLAIILVIGICGMYLAPFGMLIAKWAALKSFVDSGNVLLILAIAFGSATTMFYWTKWLAKIFSVQGVSAQKDATRGSQYVSMFIHAALVILFCILLYPLLTGFIQPMISDMYNTATQLIGTPELIVMTVALLLILLLPFLAWCVCRIPKYRTVGTYMAGINTGDNSHFVDSFGGEKQMFLSNWYLEDAFSEKKLLMPCQLMAVAFIVLMLCLIGGAL